MKSLQTNIVDHRAKLQAYIDDPAASDHLGLLPGQSAEIQDRIIQGRIAKLTREIGTFADNIRKIIGGG